MRHDGPEYACPIGYSPSPSSQATFDTRASTINGLSNCANCASLRSSMVSAISKTDLLSLLSRWSGQQDGRETKNYKEDGQDPNESFKHHDNPLRYWRQMFLEYIRIITRVVNRG